MQPLLIISPHWEPQGSEGFCIQVLPTWSPKVTLVMWLHWMPSRGGALSTQRICCQCAHMCAPKRHGVCSQFCLVSTLGNPTLARFIYPPFFPSPPQVPPRGRGSIFCFIFFVRAHDAHHYEPSSPLVGRQTAPLMSPFFIPIPLGGPPERKPYVPMLTTPPPSCMLTHSTFTTGHLHGELFQGVDDHTAANLQFWATTSGPYRSTAHSAGFARPTGSTSIVPVVVGR